jgi:hypothetical protein
MKPHSVFVGKKEITGTGAPVATRVRPARKYRKKISKAKKPFAVSVVEVGGGKTRFLPITVRP